MVEQGSLQLLEREGAPERESRAWPSWKNWCLRASDRGLDPDEAGPRGPEVPGVHARDAWRVYEELLGPKNARSGRAALDKAQELGY